MDLVTHGSAAVPAEAPQPTATQSDHMDALVIHGGRKLAGRVEISGAKECGAPGHGGNAARAGRAYAA
jgi:hypothetical protein